MATEKAVSLAVIPFLLVFATAFLLETSMHRVVFYLSSPFLIAFLVRSRDSGIFQTLTFPFILAYLIYFSASVFWSESWDAYDGLRVAIDAICVFLFCAAMARLMPYLAFKHDNIIKAAALCLIITFIYAVLYYMKRDFDFDGRLHGAGRFENPIHLSILLSLTILLLLSAGFSKDKGWLIFQFSLIFLLAVFLVMTQTRSAFLAFAACLGLFAVMRFNKIVLVLIAILLASLAVCFYFWGNSFSEFFDRGDSYRLAIWWDAIALITERPLLGYGLLSEPAFAYEPPRHAYKSTHNVILGHLYYGGIVGLILFLVLAANSLFQAGKAFLRTRTDFGMPQANLATFACLSLFFCFGLSLFNFSHYVVGVHIQWLAFWIPVSLAWYLEIENKKFH